MPSPLPRPSRERCTWRAAASDMVMAIANLVSEQASLLLVVTHSSLDVVLGDYRAVNFDWRQCPFFGELDVLDAFGFIQGLALHPLGSEGAGGDCRTAAIGLELGVFDHAAFVDLDLQTHHVAAGRSTDHAGTDIGIFGIQLADVTRVFVVVDDLVTVSHSVLPLSSCAALQAAISVLPIPRRKGRHPL